MGRTLNHFSFFITVCVCELRYMTLWVVFLLFIWSPLRQAWKMRSVWGCLKHMPRCLFCRTGARIFFLEIYVCVMIFISSLSRIEPGALLTLFFVGCHWWHWLAWCKCFKRHTYYYILHCCKVRQARQRQQSVLYRHCRHGRQAQKHEYIYYMVAPVHVAWCLLPLLLLFVLFSPDHRSQ